MSSYVACVLGSSGAVGSSLTRELLKSPRCTKVIALNRRSIDIFASDTGNEKYVQKIVNLDELESAENIELVKECDVALCALGVGQPSKASMEELYKVDVVYAKSFAKLCRAGGNVKHISLLGGLGADKDAWLEISRFKAEAEQALIDEKFSVTSLFRPSILITKQNRYGFVDVFNQHLFPFVSPILPKRFHEIKVEDLGRAMRINAEKHLNNVRDPADDRYVEFLEYPQFIELLKSEQQ